MALGVSIILDIQSHIQNTAKRKKRKKQKNTSKWNHSNMIFYTGIHGRKKNFSRAIFFSNF
jgi:hypothetical protein